jgi:Flp pilus assembly protein TadD
MAARLAPLLGDPARAHERAVFRCADLGCAAVDVKTHENVWTFDQTAAAPDCIPVADPQAVLRAHYPRALVDAIDALPVPGTAPSLDAATLVELGEALFADGRHDEAEQAFRLALREDPLDPQALNDLGVVLHVQGRLEEAELAFLRAAVLGPHHGALENAAELAAATGRAAEALRYYERLLETGGGTPQILARVALLANERAR